MLKFCESGMICPVGCRKSSSPNVHERRVSMKLDGFTPGGARPIVRAPVWSPTIGSPPVDESASGLTMPADAGPVEPGGATGGGTTASGGGGSGAGGGGRGGGGGGGGGCA